MLCVAGQEVREMLAITTYKIQFSKLQWLLNLTQPGSRGEYFSEKPIFLHTPKNGPARESRDTLSLDSIISARSPKKAIFLHIIAIYLHGSQKKVISMHNRIWNSPNLHNITYFNVLPTFSWFKGSFELPYSHMSVLRVTVPDQYFCTKHLIWI